jgi:hypothetical protein
MKKIWGFISKRKSASGVTGSAHDAEPDGTVSNNSHLERINSGAVSNEGGDAVSVAEVTPSEKLVHRRRRTRNLDVSFNPGAEQSQTNVTSTSAVLTSVGQDRQDALDQPMGTSDHGGEVLPGRKGNNPGRASGQRKQGKSASRVRKRSEANVFTDEDDLSLLEPLPGQPVSTLTTLDLDVPLIICWYDEEGRVVRHPGVYACLERSLIYGSDEAYFHLIRWEDRSLVANDRSHPVLKRVLKDKDATMLRIVEPPADSASDQASA